MLSEDSARDIASQLKEEHVSAIGLEEFRYQGKSMHPFLKDGDLMVVKHVKVSALCSGDLIIYQYANKSIAHRFLYCKPAIDGSLDLIAKGDNSCERDRSFKSDLLLGKIVQINKDGRVIYLERVNWRIMSHFIGILSLTEAVIFRNMHILKVRLFNKLRISPIIASDVARFIRAPKELLLRALLLMSTIGNK